MDRFARGTAPALVFRLPFGVANSLAGLAFFAGGPELSSVSIGDKAAARTRESVVKALASLALMPAVLLKAIASLMAFSSVEHLLLGYMKKDGLNLKIGAIKPKTVRKGIALDQKRDKKSGRFAT